MAESLAAKAGVLKTVELQLPSIFGAPQEDVTTRTMAPYVSFAHPMAKDTWSKALAANPRAEEGEQYLIVEGKAVNVTPAKLTPMLVKQFWTEEDQAGNILRTFLSEGPGLRENAEAVVLVYVGDRLVPASMSFKTTKCGAAITLAKALLHAGGVHDGTPWESLSQDHALTLACPQPFMRLFGHIKTTRRTSKKTGFIYVAAEAVVQPTGAAEWTVLASAFKDPEFNDTLQKVADKHEERMNFVLAKAK
jgi:hypothetical protein